MIFFQDSVERKVCPACSPQQGLSCSTTQTDQTATYKLYAWDCADLKARLNCSRPSPTPVTVVVDKAPGQTDPAPSAPTGPHRLGRRRQADAHVDGAGHRAAGPIRFYRIYRDTGTSVADRYDETVTTARTTSIPNPGATTAHTYWVTAVDQNFNESAPSAPVVSPPCHDPTAAPRRRLHADRAAARLRHLAGIFGATLTAWTSSTAPTGGRAASNDNAEAARVALDRAARQLRNLANRTVNAITTIDRAHGLRLHLPDVRPARKTWVRYCLQTRPAAAPAPNDADAVGERERPRRADQRRRCGSAARAPAGRAPRPPSSTGVTNQAGGVDRNVFTLQCSVGAPATCPASAAEYTQDHQRRRRVCGSTPNPGRPRPELQRRPPASSCATRTRRRLREFTHGRGSARARCSSTARAPPTPRAARSSTSGSRARRRPLAGDSRSTSCSRHRSPAPSGRA